MMQEEQALLTTITILTPGKMLSPALSDPDEGCSKRVIYFTALSRSALCEGSGGCWETSGDHTGCAKEDVCPASSTRSTVLCSSPGPPDRAENSQPLPCRDAHILESEWPQIYSAALWDLGRAVSCREWKEWKRDGNVDISTCRPSNIEYLYWMMWRSRIKSLHRQFASSVAWPWWHDVFLCHTTSSCLFTVSVLVFVSFLRREKKPIINQAISTGYD